MPGARPTDGISIKFKIVTKFEVLQFKICSTNHNEILHTSQQYNCHDVCKILLWSVVYILNQSTANFGRITVSGTGAWSSDMLQWFDLMIEHLDRNTSNGHHGDMPNATLFWNNLQQIN